MTALTVEIIRKTIKGNPRIDQEIDLDEEGKAILYTTYGWTWCAADGNRTVEGFYLKTSNGDAPDTLAYLKGQIASIESNKDEQ